jgi:phosphoribosylaminoimidazole-succinocarboxamide synthase
MGKVRNIYPMDSEFITIETTDRISAFDCILPTIIPGKGIILNQMTISWLNWLEKRMKLNHHMFTTVKPTVNSMVVRKLDMIPIECVVRGYLTGSAWKEYKDAGTVTGIKLPAGLQESQHLINPIFTPAIKNNEGHDENCNYEQMVEFLKGKFHDRLDLANMLITASRHIYKQAAIYAWEKGVIIADTKFEFGLDKEGKLTLADEVITPDSSRFWLLKDYCLGRSPKSYDKQYLRDYLSENWNKQPPAPELPPEVVKEIYERYKLINNLLFG